MPLGIALSSTFLHFMHSQPTMLCAKTLTFDLATNQGLSNQIEAGKQAPCLGRGNSWLTDR